MGTPAAPRSGGQPRDQSRTHTPGGAIPARHGRHVRRVPPGATRRRDCRSRNHSVRCCRRRGDPGHAGPRIVRRHKGAPAVPGSPAPARLPLPCRRGDGNAGAMGAGRRHPGGCLSCSPFPLAMVGGRKAETKEPGGLSSLRAIVPAGTLIGPAIGSRRRSGGRTVVHAQEREPSTPLAARCHVRGAGPRPPWQVICATCVTRGP